MRLLLRRCWPQGLYDDISITVVTKMIQGNVTRMLPVALLLVLRTRTNTQPPKIDDRFNPETRSVSNQCRSGALIRCISIKLVISVFSIRTEKRLSLRIATSRIDTCSYMTETNNIGSTTTLN